MTDEEVKGTDKVTMKKSDYSNSQAMREAAKSFIRSMGALQTMA